MLRAIDAQQIILQSSHAEKIQQVQQQHPEMQQRYFEIQHSEQRRLLQKKVKDAEEAGKAVIDDKNQQRKESRHRETDESAPQGEAGQEEAPAGGHINIIV